MRENAERILSSEPNNPMHENYPRRKSDDLQENAEHQIWLRDKWPGLTESDKEHYGRMESSIRKQIELFEAIDHTEALALNDEFDRLTESFQEKEEALRKAAQELEEFKSRLNTKTESGPK